MLTVIVVLIPSHNTQLFGRDFVNISGIYTWNDIQKLNGNKLFINYHQISFNVLSNKFFKNSYSYFSFNWLLYIKTKTAQSRLSSCTFPLHYIILYCTTLYFWNSSHLKCHTYNKLFQKLRLIKLLINLQTLRLNVSSMNKSWITTTNMTCVTRFLLFSLCKYFTERFRGDSPRFARSLR